VCYVGRVNARLDLRNAANSLQIEGKGVLLGDPYHWGGGGGRNTEHETMYTHVGMQVRRYVCV